MGLQGYEHAAVVLGDGRAARPDIADRGGDCRVAGGDFEDRLLPFLHPVGGDIRRRFADADDEAGVLLREKALGDYDEQISGRGYRGEHDAERDPAMSKRDDQAAIIAMHKPGEERFERARDPALLHMPRGRQQFCAEHGRERQRDEDGDQNRNSDGDGEFLKQDSDHATHQEERNEDRNQRNGNREDGEADLARPVEGGLHGRRAALHVPHDVLDHDDGVVDDEAHRDRKRHQGQIVEAIAQDEHHRECADEGNRDRNRGNDSRPKPAQEERDDADDEGDRQKQREAHIRDAGRDGLGPVGYDFDVNARRQRGPELRQGFLDCGDGRHDIGPGFPKNGQHNSRLAVEPTSKRRVHGRLDRPPDVPDANRRTAAIGDDRVVKALSRHQLVIRSERRRLLAAVEQARRLNDGQVRKRSADCFEIKIHRGKLGGIELDSDRRT